jgi:hypothetical protein
MLLPTAQDETIQHMQPLERLDGESGHKLPGCPSMLWDKARNTRRLTISLSL